MSRESLFSYLLFQIPESAVLHFAEERTGASKYPIVGVKNVTIFPGVPHLLEKAFTHMGKVHLVIYVKIVIGDSRNKIVTLYLVVNYKYMYSFETI